MQLDNDGSEPSLSRGEEEGSVEANADSFYGYRAIEEVFLPRWQVFFSVYWLMLKGFDVPMFACSASSYMDAEYRLRERLSGEGYNASATLSFTEIYPHRMGRELAR